VGAKVGRRGHLERARAAGGTQVGVGALLPVGSTDVSGRGMVGTKTH